MRTHTFEYAILDLIKLNDAHSSGTLQKGERLLGAPLNPCVSPMTAGQVANPWPLRPSWGRTRSDTEWSRGGCCIAPGRLGSRVDGAGSDSGRRLSTSGGTKSYPGSRPLATKPQPVRQPPGGPACPGARTGRSSSGCRRGRAAAGRSRSTRRPPSQSVAAVWRRSWRRMRGGEARVPSAGWSWPRRRTLWRSSIEPSGLRKTSF